MAVGLSAVRSVLLTRYEVTANGNLKEKLSLYCRYPQGLNDEQWQKLLKEAGQTEFARPGNR